MKEITILSGKGGAGKTSITAALASVAEDAVFCDSDVDAADLHLILQPRIIEKYTFSSAWKATINSQDCSLCGLCATSCRFDAISINAKGEYSVSPFKCEGCRLCERICPDKAISSIRSENNFWYVSNTRFGSLVHAKMGPGEENSGKLVSQVRKRAKEIAKETNKSFLLNDGPPGIGCAAISSVTGASTVLLVIEPTKSGFHDVKRLVELIRTFGVEAYALINKYDINLDMVSEIENYLVAKNIPLIGKVPFDRKMVESMIVGKSINEYSPDAESSEIISRVWSKLKI